MSHLGDIALGKTFDTKFTTVGTTGAPTVLAGSPVISAYVDNSLTQITAGITLSVDFDGVVGLNNIRVVATSGNGYAAGGNYQLVITTGTVGGTSVVGYVVAEFSIEARSSLRPTTADRTLDVSAGGEAGVDWANIGSPTTANNLSATNIDVDQIVASVSGAVGSVTGAVGSVAGAVGSVTGNVGGNVVGSVGSVTAGVTLAASAIQAIWDAATSALTTASSIGKLLVDNINATISSRASQTTVTTIDDFLDTEITTIMSDLDDIQTRLPATLVSGRMDASVGAMEASVITASAIATDAIGSAELAASAVNEIADQVWDELLSGHAGVGSTGAALSAAGDPWSTALPGAYGAGTAGKIVGDNIDATISSRASQTSVNTVDDFLDTEIAAIKAKTDSLTFTVAGYVDANTLLIEGVDATNQINAEVVDGLNVDTYTQPGQEAPAATQSIRKMVAYLYKAWRNRSTQTDDDYKLYNDDGTTVDQKAAVSDDNVTFDRGEVGTGP